MKRYASAVFMLVALCSLAISGRATLMASTADVPGIPSVPPDDFEAIRASVINPDPAEFTIDVRKFANIGVNEDAPVFAVYTSSSLPDKCGDYRDLDLSYRKPSKYKRIFDLRDHADVLQAIKVYHCIVMRNIPPKS